MNCTECENERAVSSKGTTISSGSIDTSSQPTRPKAQIPAVALVMIGVTMPTVLRMYTASASSSSPTVAAKMPTICSSYR